MDDEDEKLLPAEDGDDAPFLPQLPVTNAQSLVAAFLRRRSKNTADAYMTDLKSYAAYIGADTVEIAVKVLISSGHGPANMSALNYREHLAESGFAASTINRRLAALRSVVELAQRLGLIPWQLKVDSVPSQPYRDTRGPGLDGFKKLLVTLGKRDDTKKTRRDRAMVHLLFGMALRRFEVVSLDRADVEFDQVRLRVVGKGRTEPDYLTMPPTVVESLQSWLEMRGDADGPLFISQDPACKGDGRLTGNSLYRIIVKLGKHSGGMAVWPHALRHAAVSVALDATNGDVRAVQRFSRHKDVRTVLIYDDNRKDLGGEVAGIVAGKLSEDTPVEKLPPVLCEFCKKEMAGHLGEDDSAHHPRQVEGVGKVVIRQCKACWRRACPGVPPPSESEWPPSN